MLKAHEIVGTDKPLLKQKEDHHLELFEIVHLDENPNDYEIVAYVRIVKNDEPFFTPLYAKKG